MWKIKQENIYASFHKWWFPRKWMFFDGRFNLAGGFKPSDKYESQYVGLMTFPTEWENKSHVPVTTNQDICFSVTSITYWWIFMETSLELDDIKP